VADVLTAGERVLELARVWEHEAQVIGKRDPESPQVQLLRSCAQELREVAQGAAPEWVPHRVIVARTGWGHEKLYGHYQELRRSGLARKRGRNWEVEYTAAMAIPVKRHRADLDGTEALQEMARRLAG
jgi:hypothetical protein